MAAPPAPKPPSTSAPRPAADTPRTPGDVPVAHPAPVVERPAGPPALTPWDRTLLAVVYARQVERKLDPRSDQQVPGARAAALDLFRAVALPVRGSDGQDPTRERVSVAYECARRIVLGLEGDRAYADRLPVYLPALARHLGITVDEVTGASGGTYVEVLAAVETGF
jgi:hypothetical protein